MKKKHTAKKGYKYEGKVKPIEKINLPDSPKTQEFKVAKNTKQIKIKMPDGTIKILNVPVPKKERIGSTKYRLAKKGGKV
jgi:hypothetical protein